MPVNSISYQPASAQLLAAYRPIILKVQATATGGDPVPPFVVCDIYIADEYYKSIIRTAPETTGEWLFDISIALQEYLQPDIAVITNNNILQAVHASAKVKCKFRASDVDSDGFTVEEGTKPVQATRTTDAVSGSGFTSNEFFVINSSLQHEDNQNLATHLASYKQGNWSQNAFPLTHRNRYFFCPGDSDHFPVIFKGDCVQSSLILNYRLRGETEMQQAVAEDLNTCEAITYSVSATGNQVTVELDSAVPDDHSVVVQYRKQPDTTWIDAGNYTSQTIQFNINGDDLAGDYDIRVIHFCTPCLSSDPEIDTFTLDGSETNLAWRGINPYCIVTDMGTPVYVQLELRNASQNVIWIPDNITPTQKRTEDVAELWALFFSDPDHLNPVNVTGTNMKIYTKQRVESEVSTTGIQEYIYEEVQDYTISPSGVDEIQLSASKRTNYLEENYTTYPTVDSYSDNAYSYLTYVDDEWESGNTGEVGYADLQEYNTDTNIPTGNEKENIDSDPDYIEPETDTDTCPVGPPKTTVSYGVRQEISKVEIGFDGDFDYVETAIVGDYNYTLIKYIPRYTDVTLTVKAKTLDGTNLTGIMKVRVNYYNSSGTLVNGVYDIPNNVETLIPQVFQNIVSIAISNF